MYVALNKTVGFLSDLPENSLSCFDSQNITVVELSFITDCFLSLSDRDVH